MHATDREPTAALISGFLKDARTRGEAWIAATRLLLASLIILRTLVVSSEQLERGSVREWGLILICALGGIYSVVVMRRARAGLLPPNALWSSILADALPLFLALLLEHLHPIPGYTGVLRSPEIGFLVLALCATALRFSPRLVIFGWCIYSSMLAVLIAIDAPLMQDGFASLVATGAIIYVATGMVAYAIARRVERLVHDGATAAVGAERARQHLGAYISTEFAAQVITQDRLDMVGEQREVVVLFSDLRGFTRYAEQLAPKQLVAELNAYLDAMLPIIRAEGGIVDKYIGDSIMVVFGIPKALPDDAARALRAARGMQRALLVHNAAREAAGLTPLVQGIGIHAGPVVAGNIGTPERLQYTVIGDVVNLASRLQGATKDQKVPVLVSMATVEAARRSGAQLPPIRTIGPIELRGRQAPIEVATFYDDGVTKETMLPEMMERSASSTS